MRAQADLAQRAWRGRAPRTTRACYRADRPRRRARSLTSHRDVPRIRNEAQAGWDATRSVDGSPTPRSDREHDEESSDTMALLGSLLRRPMELYKGLHIGCVPGTHARLVELVRRHLPPCAGVLDIGAHSGALLSRLQDAGYTDLTGADLDMTRFALDGARFIKVELNQPFSAAFDRKFRLIVSTDVIEHLDSPRNFLTEARKMLEEGGLLAISLPNVAFWEGRCKFLLKGELWGFGQENYRTQRHISPVTFEQMEMMMAGGRPAGARGDIGRELRDAASAHAGVSAVGESAAPRRAAHARRGGHFRGAA